MARKEAGGGVLLGDLTVGGAVGAQGGWHHHHTTDSETTPWPLGSGFWNVLCSHPQPPVLCPSGVGSSLGLPTSPSLLKAL